MKIWTGVLCVVLLLLSLLGVCSALNGGAANEGCGDIGQYCCKDDIGRHTVCKSGRCVMLPPGPSALGPFCKEIGCGAVDEPCCSTTSGRDEEMCPVEVDDNSAQRRTCSKRAWHNAEMETNMLADGTISDICDIASVCTNCGHDGQVCCRNALGQQASCDDGYRCVQDTSAPGQPPTCASCGHVDAPCCYDKLSDDYYTCPEGRVPGAVQPLTCTVRIEREIMMDESEHWCTACGLEGQMCCRDYEGNPSACQGTLLCSETIEGNTTIHYCNSAGSRSGRGTAALLVMMATALLIMTS